MGELLRFPEALSVPGYTFSKKANNDIDISLSLVELSTFVTGDSTPPS